MCAIGKGAFGSVYKIRDKTTRIIYAAKHLINIPSNREEVRDNYYHSPTRSVCEGYCSRSVS